MGVLRTCSTARVFLAARALTLKVGLPRERASTSSVTNTAATSTPMHRFIRLRHLATILSLAATMKLILQFLLSSPLALLYRPLLCLAPHLPMVQLAPASSLSSDRCILAGPDLGVL